MQEKRIIKSSFMAGLTDVVIDLIMIMTGVHEWYFEHFKFFGVISIGMMLYAGWHQYFYYRDKRRSQQ